MTVILRHFKVEEFACRCERPDCDAVPMDIATMIKVDDLRHELGTPIYLNCGVRCSYRNARVGGAKDSYHLKGLAVDIHCGDGDQMYFLVKLAIANGFTGLGIKSRMVHLDTRPGTPKLFGYP